MLISVLLVAGFLPLPVVARLLLLVSSLLWACLNRSPRSNWFLVRLYAPTTALSDGSYVYPMVTKGDAITN
jgi:hypothetical protein